jgi:hypothetical protein
MPGVITVTPTNCYRVVTFGVSGRALRLLQQRNRQANLNDGAYLQHIDWGNVV